MTVEYAPLTVPDPQFVPDDADAPLSDAAEQIVAQVHPSTSLCRLPDMLGDAVAVLADEVADSRRPGLYGGIIVADLKVISIAELPWNGAVQARVNALDDAWMRSPRRCRTP